jgi:hypothetical protein
MKNGEYAVFIELVELSAPFSVLKIVSISRSILVLSTPRAHDTFAADNLSTGRSFA